MTKLRSPAEEAVYILDWRLDGERGRSFWKSIAQNVLLFLCVVIRKEQTIACVLCGRAGAWWGTKLNGLVKMG